jgi:tetratricopeptide (TPR) repeat protein
VWLWLAVRRAHANDPVRPRREARARLGRTLAQLKSGSPSPRLLLAWQHDTAVLWQIRHAAPGASALADSVWSTLWSECDRALYGTKPDLPSDWQARAESALAAQRVAGFNPLRAFLPRNLFPFAALVAFLALALSATQLIAADDPVASYRRGDFAAAEKAWRSAVTSNPLNPGARHNLSLALAQQARPGEALAHAAAAFVQAPAEPALRWNFALASDKAGFVPAPLAGFINPGPFHSPAQLASPAVWQRILIGASLALALALCALLHHTYGQRIRFAVPLASVVIVLALLTGAASFAGWQAYGATHDARAVVVLRAGTLRSIPTEADTTQKTSPLAAGSVAVAIGAFLDGRWTRLEFDNGQTGWVRTGELVGLWR